LSKYKHNVSTKFCSYATKMYLSHVLLTFSQTGCLIHHRVYLACKCQFRLQTFYYLLLSTWEECRLCTSNVHKS